MSLENNVINILGGTPLGDSIVSGRQSTPKLVNSDVSRISLPKRRKPKFYHHKLTQKGKFFEVQTSEKPIFYGFEPIKQNGASNIQTSPEQKLLNRKRNSYRSRKKLLDLCMTNFGKNAKALTLTFKDTKEFDVTNIKECNKKFSLFIRRLRRFYSKLKYLAVIEFQDKYQRGAIHYHLLYNLPFVHYSKLYKMWSHGYVDINKPKRVIEVINYLPKYFTKESMDERFIGHRTFFYSKNLKKPTIILGYKAKLIGEKIIEKCSVIGKPETYQSEKHGKITKTLYTRNNLPAQQRQNETYRIS